MRDEIAALPDIQGYGNVHSLHQALAKDEGVNDEIYIWQLAAKIPLPLC